MTKTLQMIFQNQAGNNVTISLSDIKDDLTSDNIKAAMNLIVSKNVFESSGGDLVALVSANIISRDVQQIDVR
ncbi:DUF2922 domain-containing protein [Caloramator sp. E03]|uniref:DUF2922 domain-containing protein n=1 Tax=Caloramator sp. E03 TaxID=2576307 RepID=UPI001FAA8933|nr:DUF2922 domain-containing protein [Caloramator sp. E03]